MGVNITAALPWPVGAAMVVLGIWLLYSGAAQRRRPVDINRLPLTTWYAKSLVGAMFVVIGAAQLAPLLQATG